MNNCHGCKWLDEDTKKRNGHGYCCHIDLSKKYPHEKVRTKSSDRCELYENGDFATRYKNINQ